MTRSFVRCWTGCSLLLAAPSLRGAELAIQHQAPSCVVAEAFPRISALITPADQVVRARVLFAPEESVSPAAGWYAVPMVRQGDSFVAVLPRPRISARRVHYAIEATDASAAVFRDDEHVAEVVGAPEACGDRPVAETVGAARVVVELPSGAPLVPPVPRGFSPVGATAVAGILAKKGGHKGLWLALAGVGAAGAAASQLIGQEAEAPTQAQPGVTLQGSSPSPGSTVSVSRSEFALALWIVLPESPPVVTVRARLYNSVSPTLACGTMRETFSAPPDAAYNVILRGFETASPCGVVDRAQISVEDDQGRVILATGTSGRPDFVIAYVFVP